MLILLIIGIWTGLVLGISFLEAPLKFTAPGMTYKIALGLGRIIFKYSNNVQLVFCLVLVVWQLFNSSRCGNQFNLMIAMIIIVMIIQNMMLLPSLDHRVIRILNGESLQASPLHMYFVLSEIAKIALLIKIFFKLCNCENFRF